MSDKAGIFRNLKEIANRYLLDPGWKRGEDKDRNFGHDTNCQRLSGRSAPSVFNARNLVDEMFDRIKRNISERTPVEINGKPERCTPSSVNWNFAYRTKHKPEADKDSTKPEVTLERAIIQARRKIEDPCTWSYQMPVATGLFGTNIDKSSNIDLVRMRSDHEFELIELKVGSNNPLYAAIEILQYGLAYAASRELASTIGYDTNKLKILEAKTIELCVLAPKEFYEISRTDKYKKTDKYNFAWLEHGLNDALLKKFNIKAHGFCMTFKFCLLDFDRKAGSRPTNETLSAINTAIDNIGPVQWGSPANA